MVKFPLQVALVATLLLLSFLLSAKQTNKSSFVHNMSRALITLNPRTIFPRVKSNVAFREYCLMADLMRWASSNALTTLPLRITGTSPSPSRAVLAERGVHSKPASPSNLL